MKYASLLGTSFAIVANVSAFAAESPYDREFKQLTDQRDKALAAAAEPINRRYQTSLEQLLRRATTGNDLETALKIKEVLKSSDKPPVAAPAATRVDNALGKWRSQAGGSVVQLFPNGNFEEVYRGGPPKEGRWKTSGKDINVTLKDKTVWTFQLSEGAQSLKRLSDGAIWVRDN